MIEAEEYSKSSKRGEYQYVSGVMEKSYNHFLSTEARAAYLNFEVTELLKFWTEKNRYRSDREGKVEPGLAS